MPHSVARVDTWINQSPVFVVTIMSGYFAGRQTLHWGVLVAVLAGSILPRNSPWASAIAADPERATIRVHLHEPVGSIRPEIFGHFTEMTLTSFEGTALGGMLFTPQ